MQGTNKGFLLGGSVGSVVAACFVVGAIGWAAPQAAEPQAASAPAAVRSQSAAAPLAAIDQTQTGGLSLDGLDGLDGSTILAHADVWEKILHKLRTGAMPPQGVRPDRATYDRLITSIESALDKDAPMPGPRRGRSSASWWPPARTLGPQQAGQNATRRGDGPEGSTGRIEMGRCDTRMRSQPFVS